MRGLELARGQSRSSKFRSIGSLVAGLLLIALIALLAPVRAYAQGAGSDSLSLSWTAPGDDGTVGTVAAYEVRRSLVPITLSNFGSTTLVSNPPTPLVSGSRQRLTVSGLTRGTPYYFAVRSRDDAGNLSGLSNLLYWDWSLDAAPPAAPAGAVAAVQSEGKAVALTWRPNAEADLAGYHVYRAESASGPWSRITTAPLVAAQYTDNAIPIEAFELLYQVSAIDRLGNESAHSGDVRVTVKQPLGRVPLLWRMLAAYPNPSRLSQPAHLPIEVPASAVEAHVDILDGGNQLVRRFPVVGASLGVAEIIWDGTNAAGRVCAPGVYRVWLIAGEFRQMVRIARVP